MSVIIIHRPSAAARAFVNAVAGNQNDPSVAHMVELANKPELTECEANWLKHEVSKHVIEIVPA